MGPVKDKRTYSAHEMVDHFYMPHRKGKILPGERQEIEGYASAYRLDPEGLSLLANWMDTMDGKVKFVPAKAGEIAMAIARADPPKPSKIKQEPKGYVREMNDKGSFF